MKLREKLIGRNGLLHVRSLLLLISLIGVTPSLFDAKESSPGSNIDEFGGTLEHVAGPSRFFQTKEVGNRWVFVTPEGNAFWMEGVFLVESTTSIDQLHESYD